MSEIDGPMFTEFSGSEPEVNHIDVLRTVIGDAVETYGDYIVRAETQDKTSGNPAETLKLYPDALNPRRVITIESGGLGNVDEGLDAVGRNGMTIDYRGSRSAVGAGVYTAGGQGVGFARIEALRMGDMYIPHIIPAEEGPVIDLVEAIQGASPERPAGRVQRTLVALGWLAREHA